MDNITVKNSTVTVKNSSNQTVSSNSATIQTGSKVQLVNSLYSVIIKGDVSCDGKISALDYIAIRNHIMGTRITDSNKLLAGDMDNNNTISALDYIAIRKLIMGMK